MEQDRTLSRTSLAQYGFMAIALSFAGLPLYIHTPDYYAVDVGLSLSVIGGIIMAVRIFDAVQDPLLGWVSQKFTNARPYLLFTALGLLAVGFLILFHPLQSAPLISLITGLLVTTTGFSLLSINYNALGSLWSKDTYQKTRITSWREALGLIGLLIAAILPSFFSLQIFSYILTALIFFSGFVLHIWLKNQDNVVSKNQQRNQQTKDPFHIKDLISGENIWFFSLYTVSMIASAIPAVLVLFFIRDLLDAERLTGIFLLLYFLSGVCAMPLWHYLAEKTCKHAAWGMAMILAILSFIWAAFLGEGDIWQYVAICLFSGMALGAELALPPSILSDQIDAQKKERQTSYFFAGLSFLSKMSLAIGS